jgi:DNA-binding NarL/FixJ family response regulator
LIKTGRAAELLRTLREITNGHRTFDRRHLPRKAWSAGPLSPRERVILRLVAAGSTNRTIATKLGIGEETVKTLLTRAFLKLDVHTRAEAVSVAHTRGLL